MNESEIWRKLYPFESNYISLDVHRYHYLDEGAGSPLLMVHGNPTWSFYWRNLVRALRADYRAVVPDHIGCGLSDKPSRYAYSLSQHIQNLVELIRHLDLRDITLLVHDWGGAIGLGAALHEPDRFSRFVLFNTAAFPPPFFPLRIRLCRTPVLGALAVRGLNLFARAAITMAVGNPRCLDGGVKEGLLAPYNSWANRVAIDRFVRDIPATPRHPTWQTLTNIEAGLPTFADRPIRLIWGMRDWCFRPSCLRRFQQHFPDADVCELNDAGHYVIEDAAEQVISLVSDFLTSDVSSPSG